MAVQGDQLARVLGPGWERMGYGQLADRVIAIERVAAFTRRLAHYVAVTEAETAGEALERLRSSRADAEEWRTNGALTIEGEG